MPNPPLIISHRGDRTRGTENTIDACDSALQNGATALEIDIRETGSGELVVFHDFSLKRMFNRPGYVGKTSLSELKKIPYANSPSKAPQFIDTLDSFLDHYQNRIPINLDAKTIHFFDFSFADKIIDTLRNHQLFDTVWVSCFNPFLLQILKLKCAEIRTGYLFQRLPWLHISYDLVTSTNAWHPNLRIVNRSLMQHKIRLNKEIFVWTVNTHSELNKLRDFELDGIITDDVIAVKNYYNQIDET